jgi:hypothetical protein
MLQHATMMMAQIIPLPKKTRYPHSPGTIFGETRGHRGNINTCDSPERNLVTPSDAAG